MIMFSRRNIVASSKGPVRPTWLPASSTPSTSTPAASTPVPREPAPREPAVPPSKATDSINDFDSEGLTVIKRTRRFGGSLRFRRSDSLNVCHPTRDDTALSFTRDDTALSLTRDDNDVTTGLPREKLRDKTIARFVEQNQETVTRSLDRPPALSRKSASSTAILSKVLKQSSKDLKKENSARDVSRREKKGEGAEKARKRISLPSKAVKPVAAVKRLIAPAQIKQTIRQQFSLDETPIPHIPHIQHIPHIPHERRQQKSSLSPRTRKSPDRSVLSQQLLEDTCKHVLLPDDTCASPARKHVQFDETCLTPKQAVGGGDEYEMYATPAVAKQADRSVREIVVLYSNIFLTQFNKYINFPSLYTEPMSQCLPSVC